MALRCIVRRGCAVAVALVVGLVAFGALAIGPKSLYKQGKKRLDAGGVDMALMHFRQLLRDYPDSKYAVEAHFLIATYYLDSRNYSDASRELRAHLKTYPDSSYADEGRAQLAELKGFDMEARATQAMDRAEYRAAKVLWEDLLRKDSASEVAQRKLAECERIIGLLDEQKAQLKRERARLEQKSKETAKLVENARLQRQEADRIHAEAMEMEGKTRAKYEAVLAEANTLSTHLKNRVAELEADLKLWRGRARQYEARLVQGADTGPTAGISGNLPRIIFEGPQADPFPEPSEQQVVGLLLDASPSVVLVGESMNSKTNMLKVEVVVGLDLAKPWPKDAAYQLKVRIDFTGIADGGTPQEVPSRTAYHALADMDNVDVRNLAYRKKLTVAVDKNTIDTYSVAAYFVKERR